MKGSIGGATLLLALTACGGGQPVAQPRETVTVTAPAPAAAPAETAPGEAPTTSPPTSEAPPAPKAARTKVPDVVGKNHQLAQDMMQAAGLYVLLEEDATGQGRALVFDRNWVVVSQSPKAGQQVGPDTAITLRAKKQGE